MKTNYQKVRDFHEKFSLPLDEGWAVLKESAEEFRVQIIEEEFGELQEAIDEKNPEHIAKELADLLYAAYGLAATVGVDVDEVFERVHQSNMSKTRHEGKADGKLIKGATYKPANLEGVI